MNKNKEYWLRMADRYFEAETSDNEERLLKRFLATDEGQDEAFDEVRAVMGVFAVGKKATVHKRRKSVVWIWTAAAAAVVGLFFVLTPILKQPKSTDICVAYVDGKVITDRSQVLAMMHSSWEDVGYGECPSVEKELEELFNGLPPSSNP